MAEVNVQNAFGIVYEDLALICVAGMLCWKVTSVTEVISVVGAVAVSV